MVFIFEICKTIVASKHVGLRIYSLSSYACHHFKLFFHLWRNGGPDWYREYSQWIIHKDQEWAMVKSKSLKSSKISSVRPGFSYANAVRTKKMVDPTVICVKKGF